MIVTLGVFLANSLPFLTAWNLWSSSWIHPFKISRIFFNSVDLRSSPFHISLHFLTVRNCDLAYPFSNIVVLRLHPFTSPPPFLTVWQWDRQFATLDKSFHISLPFSQCGTVIVTLDTSLHISFFFFTVRNCDRLWIHSFKLSQFPSFFYKCFHEIVTPFTFPLLF